VNLGIGLPLALVSAVVVSWAYVREQSAVAALCTISLSDPLTAVRALVRTSAWLVGFAAEIGSWLVYFIALRLAPLALVQSVAASGVAVLALLQAHGRPSRLAPARRAATGTAVLALGLLGISLIGSHPSDRMPSAVMAAVWLGASLAAALSVRLPRLRLSRTATSGLSAGLLFAIGDLATKLLAAGGVWLVAIVPLIAGDALGSLALQNGFQRGDALVTAGIASLATNAVPIAAGIALFRQPLPEGPLLGIQLLAYTLVVISAAMLVRSPAPSHPPVPTPSKHCGTFGSKRPRRQPQRAAVVQEGGARR
jgi:hypothetical protein